MAAVDDAGLREWLLDVAGVHTRFADKVLEVLHSEEVMDMDNLQLLAGLPRFDDGSAGV